MLLVTEVSAARQQAGSLRGVVYDKEFDVPLAGAKVTIVETRQSTTTLDQGNYVLNGVAAGKYTVVFTKDGYDRQVKADVIVTAGQLTDVDASLSGEFTEMEEYLVQDLVELGGPTELGLLQLRSDSAGVMDSIGADLMKRAGASDAAAAVRLVTGVSVQDGKYAVVRGLPDRYISSQMNGVRLPSADEDKRAIELDQFPAAIIESVRVTKTFTPDQQGDASGGAVDVRLKGIPDETILQLKAELSTNSQVHARHDFLTYEGGGFSYWGGDDGRRDIQFDNLGHNWDGAVGVTEGDAPTDYKYSLTAGGKRDVGDDIKIGGLANFFYERDSQFFDNGVDDSWWVTHPGDPMVPHTYQGGPLDGNFKTALYDVTRAEQSVRWGGMGVLGLETERNKLALTYLYTKTASDVATLAEDTRGKAYFFPGYDPNNSMGIGNDTASLRAAPYLRTETLDYTERTTDTLQLSGQHKLPFGSDADGSFHFKDPDLTWTLAKSSADSNEPDKRQFGGFWLPASFHAETPFQPEGTTTPTWFALQPSANFTAGNLQRTWQEIHEDSDEYSINLQWPFETADGNKGFLKAGLFDDTVHRKFNQDSFSNFAQPGAHFEGGFDDFWSSVFPDENHPITASDQDVDYRGKQQISAWYSMADVPFGPSVDVIGGARFETTNISIANEPEAHALWYPPGSQAGVTLNPGDADVDFEQHDVLPSIGLQYRPADSLTFRASYSETVARQTFKELTPIQQQEFYGGPVFIGNPDLKMSALQNYDLRIDETPYAGALISVSWFKKDVTDAIEYVQTLNPSFSYTTPVNYPKGQLTGYEFEVRQDLGHWTESLEGLSVGANATILDSEVTLTDEEQNGFASPGIQVPHSTRDMTNAPDHLYNLYATYDIPKTGTQFGLFYTVQGDTLVAGGGEAQGNFVPDLYAKEYDTLNLTLSQKVGRYLVFQFQAKNLTNPKIEEVYRSDAIESDVLHSSYTKGIDYSISLTANFSF
jgi:TonB-dependent receptor